jgi:methionine-rich copper-binding protein CopC
MKTLRLLGILALLIVPVNALAHAGLVSANPEANKEITAMPVQISLTFTEDLMVLDGKNRNSITLSFRPSSDVGQVIELTDLKVEGTTISATIPDRNYESGTYEVAYSIVSADGHKVDDSYRFSLNAPTLLAEPTPSPSDNGVIPMPIVAALALLILLGGFFFYRSRQR